MQYLSKIGGHITDSKTDAIYYDAYVIDWNEATQSIISSRSDGYITGEYTYRKGHIDRFLEFDATDNSVIYVTDLDPWQDKEQFYVDLQQRLYHYHKWATAMHVGIMNRYTYEESRANNSTMFIEHMDIWLIKIEIFQNLMKGAFKEVLGYVE